MMRITLLLTLVSACSAAAFGQNAGAPTFEQLARQFDYDAKAPIDVREVGREPRQGATVIDLTYASPRGGRVPAYLVVPEGRGPFAAILFGHWMMSGSPLKNRREFLEEALVLARAGAVSLLIDAPFIRPGYAPKKDDLDEAIQSSEAARQQVVDFRRDFARFAAPTRAGFYDAGHELDAAARRERVEWLAQRLSLRRPDFGALARIPPLK